MELVTGGDAALPAVLCACLLSFILLVMWLREEVKWSLLRGLSVPSSRCLN
jgi:hypothetical protein